MWDSCGTDGDDENQTKKDLKDGKSKRKKILNTNQFFMDLPEYEKVLFAIVTEDISLQNTAGLQNIKRKLWKGKEIFKLMNIVFMIGQLSLNVYTVLRMAASVHLNLKVNNFEVTEESLTICSDRIIPDCIETRLKRLMVMQVLLTAEAAVVLTMALIIVWSALMMLCCKAPHSYAKRRYFCLMAMPKLATKFSLMSFLHIGNAERLKSFIMRGEFRCLAILFLDSMRSRKREFEDLSVKRSRSASKERLNRAAKSASVLNASQSGCTSRFCQFLYGEFFGFVICGFIVFVALHMLLVKLMMVYFAGIFSYTEWTLNEWLLFMGFVNQLSGISLSSEIESLRILLFKFGGEDTRWGSKEIEACATYFRYLAERTVSQAGRWHALVLMWTLSSADLQSLFQGHQRLKEQVAVRHKEMEMFEKLHSREALEKMRDDLLSNFKESQEMLPQYISMAEKENRMKGLDQVQMASCGNLRLAARIQEHIWEWDKVELLENDRTLTRRADSKCTNTASGAQVPSRLDLSPPPPDAEEERVLSVQSVSHQDVHATDSVKTFIEDDVPCISRSCCSIEIAPVRVSEKDGAVMAQPGVVVDRGSPPSGRSATPCETVDSSGLPSAVDEHEEQHTAGDVEVLAPNSECPFGRTVTAPGIVKEENATADDNEVKNTLSQTLQ